KCPRSYTDSLPVTSCHLVARGASDAQDASRNTAYRLHAARGAKVSNAVFLTTPLARVPDGSLGPGNVHGLGLPVWCSVRVSWIAGSPSDLLGADSENPHGPEHGPDGDRDRVLAMGKAIRSAHQSIGYVDLR